MSTGPQEHVSFSNEQGETLRAILHHPASNKPSKGAILCHGMESNKESDKIVALGQALAERGVLVLRFDFSYAGESSGRFEDITYSGEVRDLEAAYEFIRRYQIEKIAILGSSMGGTVGLLFAAQQKRLACLVTVAAPLHPERFPDKLLSSEEVTLWRQQGHTSYHGQRLNVSLLDDLESINVPEAAKRIRCPLLIVHGDEDEIVPVDEAYELYALVAGSKRICILPGGDHRFSNPSLLKKAVDESIAWMTLHLQ